MIIKSIIFTLCAIFSGQCVAKDDAAILYFHSVAGNVPIQSWKTLRDKNIVKQDLDYSCGAASLATLLKEPVGWDKRMRIPTINDY